MDYFKLSQSIGIDTLINKKLLAANDIFRFVRNGDIVELAKLNNMDAEIVEFNVSHNSKVLNKKDINLNYRLSNIQNSQIITKATFNFSYAENIKIKEKMDELLGQYRF